MFVILLQRRKEATPLKHGFCPRIEKLPWVFATQMQNKGAQHTKFARLMKIQKIIHALVWMNKNVLVTSFSAAYPRGKSFSDE
jgi:hypothetical protein